MRKMSWVIIGWNVLMLVWIISVFSGADDCAGEEFREACEAGTAVGAGIGLAFILFITALGDVILGVIYLVTGKSGSQAPKGTFKNPLRECPHCKSDIRADASVCPHCQRESPAWRYHEGHWWKKEDGKDFYRVGSQWVEFQATDSVNPS